MHRGWAFCRRWSSSERVKFPEDEFPGRCNFLDNVDFFIANVEVRFAFPFAFLENNYFGFLRTYFKQPGVAVQG